MDIKLFLSVLRRFWLLVLAGLVLAVSLAMLAMVRIEFQNGKPHVFYRSGETWASSTTLFVTERGFPWGKRVIQTPDSGGETPGDKRTDPMRLTELAILYANFADSDPVLQLMLEDGPIRGKIDGSPVLALDDSGNALPLLRISAMAPTAVDAMTTTHRASDALLRYIESEQKQNAIPTAERVIVKVLKGPEAPVLLAGRSKALPALVFVAVMAMMLALVFVLDNVRPRGPRIRKTELDEPDVSDTHVEMRPAPLRRSG